MRSLRVRAGEVLKNDPPLIGRPFSSVTRILLAALAELQELDDRGKSDEYVDYRFHCRVHADDHMDNVQILPKEIAKANETPVDRTDHDKRKTKLTSAAAAAAGASRATTHKMKWGRDRKTERILSVLQDAQSNSP